MKQILLLGAASLLISSCIVRDNPLDTQNKDFAAPTFSIEGYPENGVLLGSTLAVTCSGNHPSLTYRSQLDRGTWGSWQGGAFTFSGLSDGFHFVDIEGAYPSLENPTNYPIHFSVVSKSNSLYFAPSQTPASSAELTLHGYLFDESFTSLHLELSKGTISSAAIVGTDTYRKVLTNSNVVDFSVLPGGTEISGSAPILTLKLAGLSAGDTVGFTAVVATKTGKEVTINSRVGTVIE